MAHSDQLSRPEVPAALARHRREMRRARTIYAVVVAVLVVIGFAGVRLAYAHGELDKVTSTVGPSATALPTGTPAAALRQVWSNAGQAAVGEPYESGVVVTWSGHTVQGVDVSTGKVRWSYRKADEVLCSVVQQDGSTIALYRRDGNCDQVTGITTATGAPKWWRTLTDNGPLALSSTANVVLAVSATTVHDFDNFGGVDRWLFTAPDGCQVDRALGGSKGVLISYHCGSQHHLTMHDLTTNKDKQNFDVPVNEDYVPVAAGTVLAVASQSSGEVRTVNGADGKLAATLSLGSPDRVKAALSGLPRSQTTVEATSADNTAVEIVRLDQAYAIGAQAAVAWTAKTSGWPSIVNDTVALPVKGSIELRSATDGGVRRSVSLAPSPAQADQPVFAAGSGLVVAGPTVAYYN
ncbi:PQQ-binding-like beta-propeller repeat protein [Jatrophihabitans telluris]|uniref:PQQ-binding-like beta-propeller repeat protein n=1 Tax=Jatrophihabitans telluris TaxID=2038343 RepID=A0ABY4R1U7_9ACTN|nr:PQQ-binding-like beta-propeller repeat protein [Jatrophihabitans telluris]UQX89710.1 PQQ-binding-like beta-propeller repeat protein [Jatrophihabitans telluris]